MERRRSRYQDDPRRRNKFPLGLQAEVSVRTVPK